MNLGDYVDVPTRFRLALDKWPDLRVVEEPAKIIEIGDRTFISVTRTVYRDLTDPLPAVATCWEPFPGTTPYVRNSEMMNASTSALGRVLGLMMSFGPKMASTEEVRNRQETTAPAVLVKQPQNARTQALGANASDRPSEAQMKYLRGLNYEGPAPETRAECTALIKKLAP